MTKRTCAEEEGGAHRARPKYVLIVEPDPLLRWSLTTYLGRWFATLPAENAGQAVALLGRESVATVLISDSLPGRMSERVEALARTSNPDAVVVRMVTRLAGELMDGHVRAIEKPFQLKRLARLLDVKP